MLVEPVDGRLTITNVGPGFAEIFGETLAERMREALPTEEQPDYNYGQWVQGIYPPRPGDPSAAPGRGERQRSDGQDRNDSIHCRYQRLILPFTCKGGNGGKEGEGEGRNMLSRRIGR